MTPTPNTEHANRGAYPDQNAGQEKSQHMRIAIMAVLMTSIGLVANVGAENKRGPWDLDVLFKAPKFREAPKAQKSGFKALLYSSIPYRGKPVEVFAYYGTPKGKKPASGWPAVVCIHGGGGTAFDAWVKKWNDHGYAAISMDLEGHYPISLKGGKKRGREPVLHPGPSRIGVFHDYAKPIEEQWYYHAVAQVILAHSLIRSFPEVDADRTGVTGISWGGNLTSSVMGVDTRFKFAAPVYGCGFLVGSDGHQGRAIKPGKHSETVKRYYDGSAYFHNVTYPTLWVNGTNDFHFAMPATQKSSQAVRGPARLRFELRMKHGHGPGWAPEEIYAFADSVLKGSPQLPSPGAPAIAAGTATCVLAKPVKLKTAKLFYTTDTKIWPDREWRSIPAAIDGATIRARVPTGTTALIFSVTDSKGMMVTSTFAEVSNKQ